MKKPKVLMIYPLFFWWIHYDETDEYFESPEGKRIYSGRNINRTMLSELYSRNMIKHMGFISDLALAFIAFGVGKFFRKEVLLEQEGKLLL